MNKKFTYCDLGIIDYQEAWELQQQVFQLRVDGKIEDILFLLEHPNTYTLGKTANKDHLVGSKPFLENHGVKVYEIDRGGDITFHGPGQIVGYPIIDLNNWERDTHKYLRAIEDVIMKTCSDYGLRASRNSEYTGVWAGNKKIAAIGIKVSRWITMHGFAFNINTDLSLYDGIIPCGIQDKGVTSIETELGKSIDLQEVKEKVVSHFSEVFDYSEFDIRNVDYFQSPVLFNS